MVDYKGGGCQTCGYSRCLRALDFHHLDPTTKRFSIAGSHNRSWESLRQELDRCLLVCSNCHGQIEHGFRRGPRVAAAVGTPSVEHTRARMLRPGQATDPGVSWVGELLNVCMTCGRRFAYDRRKGHTKRRCHSCGSNRATPAERQRLKRWMIGAHGGCCRVCGYSRCINVLTFHHVDPARKGFPIASAHNRGLAALRAELAKCVLVCANCHDEIEAGEDGSSGGS
jgi:DNA-directed RNA polymerase subunit RPC12/RpoP